MTRLDFDEAASMAEKMIKSCIDVKGRPYVKDFVLAGFEETIRSKREVNRAADTEADNSSDGFLILHEAARVAEVWMDYWPDVHHNGQPTHWLKVTDHLALQGKTESLLVLKDNSDLFRKVHKNDAAHKEKWELHQRARARDTTKSVNDIVDEGVKEHYLPGESSKGGQWRDTSFSLQVRSGRWIELLGCGPQRFSKAFYAFVFPALEVLGYRTPVLYL